jgi:hypothetical protein
MNIFALSNDPVVAAIYCADSHVVKMPLESAQMLSTVWASHPDCPCVAYTPTHQNHPCTRWASLTTGNYLWLHAHAVALVREKLYRYGGTHAVTRVLAALREPPPSVPAGPLLPFAQCMPDEYHVAGDPVSAYRQFYALGKRHLHSWRRRESPWWLRLYLDCKPATLNTP